jgi:hypothetical protein
VATLASLSDRLRAEIGDTARSFTEELRGDGDANRFQLTEAPINAASLSIKVNGVEVSSTAIIEEVTGMLQLASVPPVDSIINIYGTSFKYFTDSEIQYYVNTAFLEHARSITDSNGSRVTMATLATIDEYPVVLLASTMALYTLATDAAFDIDIISPDGVSIPRSERYRQLMEVVTNRKEQYRELCSLLGTGLYKIDVFTLRRISRRTNRYVPVYRPQEIDDGSMPQRVFLQMPDYGDITLPSPVTNKDLSMYSGDDFDIQLKFSMDLSTYTPLAQIRLFPTFPSNQVGPVILATFEITKTASITGGLLDTLNLHLDGSVTANLPRTAYYDIQLTTSTGLVRTYLEGKVFTKPQISIPTGQN